MEGERNPYEAPDSASVVDSAYQAHDASALAGRGTRLFALWLDGFVYLAAALPGLFIAGMDDVFAWLGEGDDLKWGALLVVALPVLAVAAYQWYLLSTTGQSLGKRWMKIRIVRVDGSPVDFVHAVLLRVWLMQALGVLPFVGNLIGLADAVMIFGVERRCLHDRIAGTIVVLA